LAKGETVTPVLPDIKNRFWNGFRGLVMQMGLLYFLIFFQEVTTNKRGSLIAIANNLSHV